MLVWLVAFGRSNLTFVSSWVAITEIKLKDVEWIFSAEFVPIVIIPALKFVPREASPLLTSAPAWAPALYLTDTYIGQSASIKKPAFNVVAPPVRSWSINSADSSNPDGESDPPITYILGFALFKSV